MFNLSVGIDIVTGLAFGKSLLFVLIDLNFMVLSLTCKPEGVIQKIGSSNLDNIFTKLFK